MSEAVVRKLVFRLGEIGFSLDLAFVVEICQPIDDLFDASYVDATNWIVGALDFRNTRVPAVDPALALELVGCKALADRTALILTGPEGNWALLVDRVEAISPQDKFQPVESPPLLRSPANRLYAQLELFHSEPLVCLNPENFYAASALAI